MAEAALAVAIPQDEVQEEQAQALTFVEQGKALKVVDAETYTIAGTWLVDIKKRMKTIDDKLVPKKDAAHKLWKSIVALIDELKAPYLELEAHFKRQIAAYNAEQERIRREEEARLREIARKAEEERRLAEALEAEAAGQSEEAAAILDEPVFVPPPVVEKMTPKVEGVSFTKVWKFEVTHPNMIPREYLSIDTVKIGGVVRATKGAIQIPGVRIWAEDSVRAGGR